jgi:exosome complex component RRP4
MGKLLIQDKEIVFPGQVLAQGMDFLPSGQEVLREGEDLIATRVGLVSLNNRLVKLIPLTGTYTPKVNDIVIGKVTGTAVSGWRVKIGCPYEAVIPLKDGTTDFVQRGADLTKYYNYGDYVVAQISQVYNGKLIDLSMKGPGLRKLFPGRVFNVPPMKVPRIIGKKGSMISMIKEHTGCRVSVGQNGVVWLSGDEPAKEQRAMDAIDMIIKNSHKSGLTDTIKEFLEK